MPTTMRFIRASYTACPALAAAGRSGLERTQGLAQPDHGGPDAGLDRAEGLLEAGRDLALGQALEVRELERAALILGQRLERPAHRQRLDGARRRDRRGRRLGRLLAPGGAATQPVESPRARD